MADAYIDQDYCYARFGETLTTGLSVKLGGVLSASIESSTASIQRALVARGYSAPATTEDEFVKLAVFGCLWEMLASMPKASVQLPKGWADNPYKRAYEDILSGDADLTGSPSHSHTVSRGVGGWLFSDRSATSDDPQKTSKDELAGY